MTEVGVTDDAVGVHGGLVVGAGGLVALQDEVLSVRIEAVAEAELLKAPVRRGCDVALVARAGLLSVVRQLIVAVRAEGHGNDPKQALRRLGFVRGSEGSGAGEAAGNPPRAKATVGHVLLKPIVAFIGVEVVRGPEQPSPGDGLEDIPRPTLFIGARAGVVTEAVHYSVGAERCERKLPLDMVIEAHDERPVQRRLRAVVAGDALEVVVEGGAGVVPVCPALGPPLLQELVGFLVGIPATAQEVDGGGETTRSHGLVAPADDAAVLAAPPLLRRVKRGEQHRLVEFQPILLRNGRRVLQVVVLPHVAFDSVVAVAQEARLRGHGLEEVPDALLPVLGLAGEDIAHPSVAEPRGGFEPLVREVGFDGWGELPTLGLAKKLDEAGNGGRFALRSACLQRNGRRAGAEGPCDGADHVPVAAGIRRITEGQVAGIQGQHCPIGVDAAEDHNGAMRHLRLPVQAVVGQRGIRTDDFDRGAGLLQSAFEERCGIGVRCQDGNGPKRYRAVPLPWEHLRLCEGEQRAEAGGQDGHQGECHVGPPG